MSVIARQSPYREVRSLERGLVLLETLARIGWATPTRLACETGIQRSTIYRIMNTLEQCEYVTRREADGTYFLTSKMSYVGREVTYEDVEIDIISQALSTLVGRIHWPSDFAVIHSGQLTIMASNHRLTTMSSFRALIGALRSALGRALLSAMNEDQLERALEEAVNIVFFRSAMSCEKAAERYLGKLGARIAEIEQRIAQATFAGHCH